MADRYAYQPGKHIGPWTLVDPCGVGGNGEVWKASRDGGPAVALKILNATKAESERYGRFRREVAFYERLGPRPGVVPVLATHLLERPSKRDRAWLAMPIAIGIDRPVSSHRRRRP